LFVVLGPNPDQAAAGNHGHNVVTSTASGFMSPAMLAALGGFQSEADLRNGSLRIDLDGDGAALLSGVKAYAVMPYSGTVTGWDLAAPLSGGSLIIDVWRRPYAAFPPRAVDTMAGSELPTLVSGAINRDLSLTTWAVANGLVGYFDKEDVLAFYVMPGSTVKRANLQLRINRA